MKKLHFIFFFLIVFNLYSQNLVPNGDFELYVKCPSTFNTDRNMTEVVQSWKAINNSTPDYYNACSKGNASVPYNWAGKAYASSGNAYIGIYVYGANNEFIRAQLTDSLEAGKTYFVSLKFRLSSYSRVSIGNLDISLGKSDNKNFFNYEYVKKAAITPQTGNWESIEFEYTADGGEYYVTIGNKSYSNKTRFLSHKSILEPMLKNHAYFYIDDVTIIARNTILEEDVLIADIPFPIDEFIAFENLLFAVDQSEIPDSAFDELDRLVETLHSNQQLKLELRGHTDTSGTDTYNLKLSKLRASSVAKYLIDNGIEITRIEVVGLGESQLLNEDTAESEYLNRRVEFKLFN